MKEQEEDWSLVIKPGSGLFDLQLSEMLRYYKTNTFADFEAVDN